MSRCGATARRWRCRKASSASSRCFAIRAGSRPIATGCSRRRAGSACFSARASCPARRTRSPKRSTAERIDADLENIAAAIEQAIAPLPSHAEALAAMVAKGSRMSAVRHVAIVGRDAPLWLASLSLQHALGPAGIAVSAIELPSQLSEHHAYAASPVAQRAARADRPRPALGPSGKRRDRGGRAAPRRLVRATLFHRFRWAASGVRRGRHRPALDCRAARRRERPARAPFAGGGRPGPGQGRSRRTRPVGVRRDPPRQPSRCPRLFRVAPLGRDRARHRPIARFRRSRRCFEGTSLARIDCPDGEPVHADLYVDASGADAVLASAQPGDDWTDWGSDLPIRKLWWASAPALQPFPPFAELNSKHAGMERAGPARQPHRDPRRLCRSRKSSRYRRSRWHEPRLDAGRRGFRRGLPLDMA